MFQVTRWWTLFSYPSTSTSPKRCPPHSVCPQRRPKLSAIKQPQCSSAPQSIWLGHLPSWSQFNLFPILFHLSSVTSHSPSFKSTTSNAPFSLCFTCTPLLLLPSEFNLLLLLFTLPLLALLLSEYQFSSSVVVDDEWQSAIASARKTPGKWSTATDAGSHCYCLVSLICPLLWPQRSISSSTMFTFTWMLPSFTSSKSKTSTMLSAHKQCCSECFSLPKWCLCSGVSPKSRTSRVCSRT